MKKKAMKCKSTRKKVNVNGIIKTGLVTVTINTLYNKLSFHNNINLFTK